MAKANIITAVDIGTSAIKGLQVQKIANSAEPELLAIAKETSEGIRKGVVGNSQQVANKIRLVLDQLVQISQQRVDGVVANISGSHIFLVPSRGGVVVSRADQKISNEDVDRALASAQAFPLPANKEILEAWPREFVVDQERGIREPLGMKGIRLEAEILALCGFSPYIKNATDAILGAKTQLLDLIPSSLASARAVLTPRQKELGCAVLDIGARTTDFAVFEEGELIHAVVFPVGSANITDDIAIALRVDTDVAEKMKLEFGVPNILGRPRGRGIVIKSTKKPDLKKTPKQRLLTDKKTGKWEIEAANGSLISFSPAMLSRVLEARLRDIFDEVNKDLRKIGRQELLPAGVVLTGGGAKLANIAEIAKRELKLPCQIGFPSKINGLTEDPSLSTLCGLAMEGLDALGGSSTAIKFAGFNIKSKVRDFFRMFIP